MKRITKYIGVLLTALLAGGAMTSCQNDFDAPGLITPGATLQPNTTIAELKAEYWNDADNYIDTIRLAESGERKVVAGRVVSSDASGNIYKNLVIQDETGALTMSINANSLYNNYRIGQEIVIDLTDMYIGKYSTLQQLGFPDYSPAYGWQATFMPLEFFKQHIQLNGLPEPSKIDTLTISISDLGTSIENLQKYQSRLVRINNVSFEEGGEASFCTAHKVNTNRTLKDANGNSIIVRTSGYANFWSTKLPAESGDIVGILSTYKSGGALQWQLLLRSTDDLLNFGNPTLPKGTEDNPYDITEAITMVNTGSAVSGWFTGYIVGTVKAGTETVTTDEDIVWNNVDTEVATNLVIGQTPETTTLSECVLLPLPQGSPLREYGNLLDNKDNYLKQIWVLATPGEELGMKALLKNSGAANTWRIDGVDIPGGETPGGAVAEGDGSEAKPYNAAQVLAKGKSVSESGKWVSGYIVGYIPDKYLDGALFTVPATSATNILLAVTPDETDYSKCLPIQLPQGNIRAALNLMDNPGNHKQLCSVYGNLMAYFGVAGVKETSNYKIDGSGSGSTTPDVPSEAVTAFSENFDTATNFPTASGFTIKETSGNASWFIRKADNNNPTNCAEVTAYGNGKTAGANGFISWMISCPLNVDAMSEKVLTFKSKVGYTGNGTLEVYALSSNDPATATKTKLNANIPQPTGSWGDYVESGNVSLAGLSGTVYIGFCYTAAQGSNYTTYRIEDVVAGTPGEGGGNTGGGEDGGGTGDGGDDGDDDGDVTHNNSADFETLTTKSSYTTQTTTAGWVATNCAVQAGGAKDANPVFTFIGDSDAVKAVCLNGKSSAPGSLVSPSLSGGIKSLKFNYGFAFSDSQCKITINIKQNGAVVKTQTLDITSITKFAVCDFSMDCNVSGDFVIEIVNDCKTGTDKNVDRISIWNLTWANM